MISGNIGDAVYPYNSILCTDLSVDIFESWIASNRINFRTNGQNAVGTSTIKSNKAYTITIGRTGSTNYVVANGVRAELTSTISSSMIGATFAIGAYPEGNTPSDYQLDQFMIYQEGILTHNLLPVKRKNDGKYFLYNTLNNKVYPLVQTN